MYAESRSTTAPAVTARAAAAPTTTPRAELRRRDSTAATCGWVTDISVPGGDGELRGYMPLTCAPGMICGSVNEVRGCCSDPAACAGELAVYCYDSSAISTASPTTEPVLYCSDPVRPSCIKFWFADNFYNSFACGPSELYDVGTYFGVYPGSATPTDDQFSTDIVTTFTTYLTDASPAAATTSAGSSSGPDSTSGPVLPTFAIIIIAVVGSIIVITLVLSAARRNSRKAKEDKTYIGRVDQSQPSISRPPSPVQPHNPLLVWWPASAPAQVNVDNWRTQQARYPHGPPDNAIAPSLAETGIGSEHHGQVPNWR